MLTLLSPAKTLDFESAAEGLPTTEPRFEEDIEILLKRCKKLTVAEIRKLMKTLGIRIHTRMLTQLGTA